MGPKEKTNQDDIHLKSMARVQSYWRAPALAPVSDDFVYKRRGRVSREKKKARTLLPHIPPATAPDASITLLGTFSGHTLCAVYPDYKPAAAEMRVFHLAAAHGNPLTRIFSRFKVSSILEPHAVYATSRWSALCHTHTLTTITDLRRSLIQTFLERGAVVIKGAALESYNYPQIIRQSLFDFNAIFQGCLPYFVDYRKIVGFKGSRRYGLRRHSIIALDMTVAAEAAKTIAIPGAGINPENTLYLRASSRNLPPSYHWKDLIQNMEVADEVIHGIPLWRAWGLGGEEKKTIWNVFSHIFCEDFSSWSDKPPFYPYRTWTEMGEADPDWCGETPIL